jgi:hypothetical protein
MVLRLFRNQDESQHVGIPTSVLSQPDVGRSGSVRPDVVLYCTEISGRVEFVLSDFHAGNFVQKVQEDMRKVSAKVIKRIKLMLGIGCTEVKKVGIDDGDW